MTLLSGLITIILAGIMTENMVLAKFLGICPFLGVSKKLNTALSMSLAVIFVMVLATLATYPIYALILVPLGLDYLQTIVFILIIAALVQLVEIILKKFLPPVYSALGIYLPLITTNCAVLGITILHFTSPRIEALAGAVGSLGYSFGVGYLAAIVNAIGAGLGFLVAMVLFAGVRRKIDASDIPEALKGLPITLIAAALVSLSFMGFSGII